MSIDKVQSKLKQEFDAIQVKLTFVTELQALMKKANLDIEGVKSLLDEIDVAPAPKKRGRPAASKNASTKKPAAKRKKHPPRPQRKFKHPKSGEVVTTAAPQVNKQIKEWAKELNTDWQKLEI
tara:strand:+ start:6649 stop:7017 length:369 start_codon:yes stop_codon:yes gene_type:complete